MARAFIAALLVSLLAFGAHAHAQIAQPLSLSLIRAVRVSDTAITISYRTDAPSYGQIAYSTLDNSKFTLTDSAPQTDHLFTIDQLDPAHGYSFALSASAGTQESDTYTVLLAPGSIGLPGQSIMPGVVETDASGKVITTTLTSSSSPATDKPFAPWWTFIILLILVIAGWIGYGRWKRRALFHREFSGSTDNG